MVFGKVLAVVAQVIDRLTVGNVVEHQQAEFVAELVWKPCDSPDAASELGRNARCV